MPYFHNNEINLLLIHIPKTGGTSLENFFSKKFNIPLQNKSLYGLIDEDARISNNIEVYSSLQHLTYNTIMKYKDFFNINTDNLEIITIVRNPYNRVISDLFFLQKIDTSFTKEQVHQVIRNYLLDKNDNHSLPQHSFITDENNKIIDNIRILRTESLNKDMRNLGYVDFDIRSHVNTRNVNYFNYLNSNSIYIINTYYHMDFVMFNYMKIKPS